MASVEAQSALFSYWERGELTDSGLRHSVAHGLCLRPEAIRVFCGPGIGGDAHILLRQLVIVLDSIGSLVGFGDRFLDRVLNDQEANA